jgi:hypothetical protein
MLATSLQQWVRRYVQITQSAECSPHDRARLHKFFAKGKDKYRFHRVAEALPALVHLSLFLFFAGLVVYLFNTNHTAFTAVICWVALLSVTYGFITFMPFIWIDSPYYSPLTPPAWFLFTGVLYIALGIPCRMMSHFDVPRRIWEWVKLQVQRTHPGIWEEAKNFISKHPKDFDFSIFAWTLALDEGDEQEKVFKSIPGFFKSDEVKLGDHLDTAQSMTEDAICHFLRSTLSSNIVHGSVKIRRLATCLNTASEALLPNRGDVIGKLINMDWGGRLDAVTIGHSLRSWDEDSGGHFTPYVHGIIAIIVASVQKRDKSWATLTRNHLGVQDTVFNSYKAHGDSVLLANFIHFTRNAKLSDSFSLKVVWSISNFDIRDTRHELQHDFCAMWNDLVQEAQNHNAYSRYVTFLKEIHHYYITLHRGTEAAPTTFSESITDYGNLLWQPSSYQLCNISTHHSHSAVRHNHDVPAAAAVPCPHPASTSLHHDYVLTTTAPFLSPSSHPDDTTTKSKDQPTIRILPSPVILSSFLAPPVVHKPSPSLVTPPDPAVSTSGQATARHPSMSSAVAPDADHLTLEATISTPHVTFPPSTDGTIAAVSFPPSMVPVVLFSPYPPTFSSDVPPSDSPPFPMPSPPRSTEASSGEEVPHPSPSTVTSHAACKSVFDHGATVALSAAKGDPPDSSI